MRVVVLGGGYAGLVLATRLDADLPPEAELVVVDETGDHLIQHELHRVVRRPSFADDITVPLTDVLDDAEVLRARVDSVDRAERSVALDDGSTLDYDVAAVCLGAETAFYDLPGVEDHSTPLKRLGHAYAIRERFLELLASGGGTVVVGGAGLSGVQVAGELAAFAREEGARDDVRLYLLEQASDVAPSFPEHFRDAVRDALLDRGVELHTGRTVERATEDAIEVAEGDPLHYDQFVWTGGIRGPSALSGDRPQVRGTLALDEHTFSLGDAARVVDADGEPVPASAQAAVREAHVAARNVLATVRGSTDGFRPRLDQFRFDSPGWIVSVGDEAVAQVGPTVFTGPAAEVLKDSVGVGYLATSGAIREAVELAREEFRPWR